MGNFLLVDFSPWVVTAAIIAVILILIIELPRVIKSLINLPLLIKILFLLSILIGGYIRLNLVPSQHRIYFDEDRYLSGAVTFSKYYKTGLINIATPRQFILGEPDTAARITTPTINGWILKLFGNNENNLFIGAKVMSTFQIVLIFIACLIFLKSKFVATFSAIVVAIIPINVYWSTSIGLDPSFIFFALLAFLASSWYAREVNIKSSIFLTSSTLLLLFVRLESFLFLPIIALVIFAIRKSEKLPIFTKKDLIFLVISSPFIGIRALISISVLGQTWCCGEATPLEAFSSSYFLRNTIPNIVSLFRKAEFPFVLTILSSLYLMAKTDIKKVPLALWIFFYFFLYSFYFAGLFYTVEFSGSYGRYLLMLVPPMTILSAMFLEDLYKNFGKFRSTKKILMVIIALVMLLSLYPSIKNYKKMITTSPYDAYVDVGPRQIHDFLEKVILPQTPPDAVIIHSLTSIVLLNNRATVYFGTFLNNELAQRFVTEAIKTGHPVYMIQTYSCDTFPDKCALILDNFKLVNAPINDVTGYGYELLKVELK